MPSVNHRHSVRLGVELRQGHGHEPPVEFGIEDMAVDPGQDLFRGDANADEVAYLRADARRQ